MAADNVGGEIIVRILGLEEGVGVTPRPPGATATPSGLFLPPGVMAPPSVSGIGGVPTSPGGTRGAAATNPLLSPEQQEALKSTKQQERRMSELKEYQKQVLGEEEKKQTGLLSGVMAGPLKFLAGALGIGALISQSKIIGTLMSTLTQTVGVIVDLILLPLVPGIVATLQLIAKFLSGLSKFMQDPTAFLKDIFVSIFRYIKEVFEAWLAPLKTLWDGIKTIAEDVVSLVKALFSLDWDDVVTAAKKIWDDIKLIASKVWDEIKTAFLATFPFLKKDKTEERLKGPLLPGLESGPVIPGTGGETNPFKVLFGPVYSLYEILSKAIGQAGKEVFSKNGSTSIILEQNITIDSMGGTISTRETIYSYNRITEERNENQYTRTIRA